jgi:surface protein
MTESEHNVCIVQTPVEGLSRRSNDADTALPATSLSNKKKRNKAMNDKAAKMITMRRKHPTWGEIDHEIEKKVTSENGDTQHEIEQLGSMESKKRNKAMNEKAVRMIALRRKHPAWGDIDYVIEKKETSDSWKDRADWGETQYEIEHETLAESWKERANRVQNIIERKGSGRLKERATRRLKEDRKQAELARYHTEEEGSTPARFTTTEDTERGASEIVVTNALFFISDAPEMPLEEVLADDATDCDRETGTKERVRNSTWFLLLCLGVIPMFCLVVIVVGLVVGVAMGSDKENVGNSTSYSERPTVSPTSAPSSEYQCLYTRESLLDAVDAYLSSNSPNSTAAEKHGWPIGSWCVSNIENLDRVFSVERNPLAESFDESISEWDVSGAQSMASMFNGAVLFNQDLSAWDVSTVRDMANMFRSARAFNQDLSNWVVTSLTSMSNMFYNASAFDQELSTWNVSKVTDFTGAFSSATSFNRDISSWNTASATSMEDMFYGAFSFNQDISAWNLSSVTRVSGMFRDAAHFNQNVSPWDVSRVLTMRFMFSGAALFNQDLSDWDTSQVKDMAFMFREAMFNQNVSSWDVSSVSTMEGMFSRAVSFNQALAGWNTSSLRDVSSMFQGATVFNQDLSRWKVSGVTAAKSMFQDAVSFDQDLSAWDVRAVEDFTDMFYGATSFKQDLCKWGLAIGGSVTLVSGMFANTACLTSADVNLVGAIKGPFCVECTN